MLDFDAFRQLMDEMGVDRFSGEWETYAEVLPCAAGFPLRVRRAGQHLRRARKRWIWRRQLAALERHLHGTGKNWDLREREHFWNAYQMVMYMTAHLSPDERQVLLRSVFADDPFKPYFDDFR